jgi:hypothetical protein
MVFGRFFVVMACAFTFFLNEGFANPKEKKEGQVSALSLRRKKRPCEGDKENQSPLKAQKTLPHADEEDTANTSPLIPSFLSTLTEPCSPTKIERKFWSPVRRKLTAKAYKTSEKKSVILSPEVRKIYKENDAGNYFSRKFCFEGKTVFQVDPLVDPQAEALSKSGLWETNLQRMQAGRSPIGYKGIINKADRNSLQTREIHQQQDRYRIELQHMTQKDTNTEEDPLCEMTYAAHMGKNARLILEQDPKTLEVDIIASSLEKEEALARCAPNQFITTNVLHFRKGSSLIDRPAFNEWRTAYWKHRAKEIEAGNFIKVFPQRTVRVNLFGA